jgi:hypothetical protein
MGSNGYMEYAVRLLYSLLTAEINLLSVEHEDLKVLYFILLTLHHIKPF